MRKIAEFFEKHNDQFLKSNEPARIRQMRILEKLYPICNHSLIDHATHEMIYFDVKIEKFASSFTSEEMIELMQYGLLYDIDYGCLKLYI